jgi:hypothetical protein
MNNVIFLFGASCSGKSTLGKELQNQLGSHWTYLDRDDLIEQNLCTDATADATLEERIQSIKHHMIIDAQIPWRPKREGELYILIFPPLEILLDRDAERSALRKRPLKRAQYAREYVIKTHETLNKLEKSDFDCCFDSSQVSVQDEIDTITSMSMVSHHSIPPIYSHVKYTAFAIASVAIGVICLYFLRASKTHLELKMP